MKSQSNFCGMTSKMHHWVCANPLPADVICHCLLSTQSAIFAANLILRQKETPKWMKPSQNKKDIRIRNDRKEEVLNLSQILNLEFLVQQQW